MIFTLALSLFFARKYLTLGKLVGMFQRMKSIFLTLVLLSSWSLQALPVGNLAEASLYSKSSWFHGYCYDPCDPSYLCIDHWKLRFGFYGDYIFDQNMEIVQNELPIQLDIIDFKMNTNAAYLVLNIANRVDIFATLGATDFSFLLPYPTILGIFETKVAFDSAFSWSLGSRATLLCSKYCGIGIEGQYFRINTSTDQIIVFPVANIDFHVDALYESWQVAPGVYAHLALPGCPVAFVPYVAVKASWSRLTTQQDALELFDFATVLNIEEEKIWGYAIGISMSVRQKAGVVAEVSLGNQKEFHVKGQLCF